MSIHRFAFLGFAWALLGAAIASAGEPVELFNGKDLSGWTQRGGAARYSVEDRAVVGRSVPDTSNTFLATDKEYGDFELELDFKIDDPAFNSGVQIRSHVRPEGGSERVFGYQVEIDPDPARSWSAGIYFEGGSEHREAGWLNELANNKAARDAFRLGEWNHLKIIANGRRIQTWLNGVPAADFTDTDDKAFVPTGFIALQVHSVGSDKEPKEVRWRNIKLTELDSTEPDEEQAPGADAKKTTGLQLFARAVAAMFGLNREAADDEAFLRLLGEPAPSFELATVSGETVKLQDLRGKVVLLDFWASWCGPCMLAMPEVEKIHKQFADKPVMVVGVNLQDEVETVKEAIKTKEVTFTQLLDTDGAVSQAFAATAIPHTVLIDADGRVQRIHQGYSETMAEELADDIEKLLRGEALFKPKNTAPDAVQVTE